MPAAALASSHGIALLLSLQFLVFLAFNFFYIAFPVHAATALEWSLTQTGIFFSVLGLMMALVQGPLLGRAARSLSNRFLVIVGCVILAASFPFFTVPNTAAIYVGAALLALGNGIMWPSLLALVSMAADSRVQGAVQGLASSGGAVASIVGLLAGGMLYGFAGGAVFLIAAAITVAAFLMTFGIARNTRAPQTNPDSSTTSP